jgi:hypothetical protein
VFGHLLQHDELLLVMAYILWSLTPRKKGARNLLPSEKLRRARADYDEFEMKKAEFAAAGEKAPRKKAIEFLMTKWNVNDESTVEKRIAKWGKTPEAAAQAAPEDVAKAVLATAEAIFSGQRHRTAELTKDLDDEIPF